MSALGIGVACVATAMAACPAYAQVSPDVSEAELRQQVDELIERDARSQARIQDLERRLQAVEAATGLQGSIGTPLTEAQEADIRGRGATLSITAQTASDGSVSVQTQDSGAATAASVPPQPAETETAANTGDEDRKTPAPSEAVEDVTRREQGIFGPRLSFEAGVTYSHFDNAQLNLSGFLALDSIFLGLISLDQIVSDVWVGDLTVRYGLTDRLQFDVTFPYLYRHSNFQSGGAGGNASGLAEIDLNEHGLGDISFGASYRVVKETLRWPDVVVNVRGKAPTGEHPFGVELVEVPGSTGNLRVPARLATGSGVWGASAGISVLKTIDPMVVFGSVTYFRNFKEFFSDLDEANFDQPGWAKIGDAIQWGAGVAFALNDRSSLSTSFTQRIAERTRLLRTTGFEEIVVGSQANVGILNVGATFALSRWMSLITTIGVGMTQDAPDMTLSVRVPFRF